MPPTPHCLERERDRCRHSEAQSATPQFSTTFPTAGGRGWEFLIPGHRANEGMAVSEVIPS
jgi:hypothetical protein